MYVCLCLRGTEPAHRSLIMITPTNSETRTERSQKRDRSATGANRAMFKLGHCERATGIYTYNIEL